MQPGKAKTMLYVFFGLIASGKSTLAERFANQYGFLYLNTDLVRKEIAGINHTTRQSAGYDQGIYTSEFSRRTYQTILDKAGGEISAGGKSVVLDGSYSSIEERARVLELADSIGTGCVFIQCICSEDTVRKRLAFRAKDPAAVSDGRWEIYQVQKEKFQSPSELDVAQLVTVETEENVDTLVENIASILNLR